MNLFAIFEAERLARGANYQVTLDDVASFLERYVYNNPDTVFIDGTVASVLWTFRIGDAETQSLSLTLAEQSGGKIRAIGTTEAGKFLTAILSEDYDDFRDFKVLPIAPDGSDPFWSKLSRFFVENTDHPLITITPRGLASSVYGTTEVKAIAANDGIELINGVARSEIGFDLFSSSEAARKAYLTALFNGEFSGDLIASNAVTIWQTGPVNNPTYYFDFDEATKAALGLAGIDFAPVPVGASLAVSQQEIRDDVLPAFARGLHVALFGPLLNRAEDKFLNFVGSDIDTADQSRRTAPEPSDEFKKLQDKLGCVDKRLQP